MQTTIAFLFLPAGAATGLPKLPFGNSFWSSLPKENSENLQVGGMENKPYDDWDKQAILPNLRAAAGVNVKSNVNMKEPFPKTATFQCGKCCKHSAQAAQVTLICNFLFEILKNKNYLKYKLIRHDLQKRFFL